MKSPRISIFIPTGSRASSLERVLESLTKQSYKNFEVLIVDYKSTDNTLVIVKNYLKKLRIKVLNQTKKGLSLAANLSLRSAKGEIFIRTDDDVIMSVGWLKAINDTFESDKRIGGVTGPTVIPNKNIELRDLFYFEEKFKKGNLLMRGLGKVYFGYFMEGSPYAVSRWYRCGAFSLGTNFKESLKQPIQEVSNLEACNFSVRTRLLRKIGGFDMGYTGVGEYHEPDAALKIKKLGYKLIFNPKAMLNHCPSQDGFFHDRPSSFGRMTNFIRFHQAHLKSDKLQDKFRFALYLLFLNIFYIYLAITRRQYDQLGAIPGTITGLINTKN